MDHKKEIYKQPKPFTNFIRTFCIIVILLAFLYKLKNKNKAEIYR